MRTERWRDVVGYEGFYEVSSFGRVRTKTRTFPRPHNKTRRLVEYTYPGAQIRPWINATTGYPMVNLCKRGAVKKDSVHRLVLLAFVGRPPTGTICCHADGDPKNNHLENLRWDSYSANVADTARHGRVPRGERNVAAKLTRADVLDIRQRLVAGERASAIGKTYRVTKEAIYAIRDRKNWAWLPA